MNDEWKHLELEESILDSCPNNEGAAFWGDYSREEYALGRSGSPMGLIAAIRLLEGDFSCAIELLESKDAEIPPVFLNTILELLKGEAVIPATQENVVFEIGRLNGKRGAPNKSLNLTTMYKNLEIGSEMHQRYQINGEKYEIASMEVAAHFKVSESTVNTIYSWYKTEAAKGEKKP